MPEKQPNYTDTMIPEEQPAPVPEVPPGALPDEQPAAVPDEQPAAVPEKQSGNKTYRDAAAKATAALREVSNC